MGLTVAPARTDEERAAVWAFRYRVYVDELGLDTPEADPERRWLRDDLDDHATTYGLWGRGEVLGTLRVAVLSDLPEPERLVRKLSMGPAVEAFGVGAVCATSRFMLDPAKRHGTAILRLMQAGYDGARERGVRFNVGDCSPELLPLYEHMGYRRYAPPFEDPAYGFKVPILMLMGDRELLERVRSPLARVACRYPRDPEVVDWFGRTYPRARPTQSAAMLGPGAFLDLLASRIGGDPLDALDLLDGLDRRQAERLLARATLVQVGVGQTLIREGEPGDAVYALTPGSHRGPARRGRGSGSVGAGGTVGESGFATGRRTASVRASTPCEAVVIPGDALRSFLEREPDGARRVRANLERTKLPLAA